MGNQERPYGYRDGQEEDCLCIRCTTVTHVREQARELRPRRRFLTNATALACTIVDALNCLEITEPLDFVHCLQLSGRFHQHLQSEGLLHMPWLSQLRPFLEQENAGYRYEWMRILLRHVNRRARRLEGGGLPPEGYAWLFHTVARYFDPLAGNVFWA